MKVYLAGPITGLSYGDAESWRQYAIKQLVPLTGFDPLRGKAFLKSIQEGLSGTGEEYAHMGVMSQQHSIVCRDHYDVISADCLLVNLLGAERVSIGTCCEIAWAWDRHIPVVCAIEDGNQNIHAHMFIWELIGFRTPNLDEAIGIVRTILMSDPRTEAEKKFQEYKMWQKAQQVQGEGVLYVSY